MSDKPCGTCDVCKEVPAKYWYGRTSAATCGAGACVEEMDTRYAASCKAIDEEIAFEKQMEEEYGRGY